MFLTVTTLLLTMYGIDLSSGFIVTSDSPCSVPQCICSEESINCNSRGLSDIPIYYNTTRFNTENFAMRIYMEFNNILHLRGNSFITWFASTLGDQIYISLRYNQMVSIDYNAFKGLEKSINALSLSHNNLTHIPDAISKLENLHFLDLDHNPITHFTAASMRSIGQSLISLEFSYVNFQQWPKQLKYLTKLDLLKADAENDATTTLVPTNAFQGFEDTLYSIEISVTTFPDGLCSLVNVSILRIDFQNDNAPFPTCVNRLQKVQTLAVSRGMSHFPDLTLFPALRNLIVSDNPNLYYIPDDSVSVSCPILTMSLSRNSFRTIPLAVHKCSQLRDLDVSYNQISIFERNSIETLPLLETLDLSSNPLSYFSSRAFENLPALRTLLLNYTLLVSISPLSQIVTLTSITLPKKLACSCGELDWLEKPVHRHITFHSPYSNPSSFCINTNNETLQHYISTSLPLC